MPAPSARVAGSAATGVRRVALGAAQSRAVAVAPRRATSGAGPTAQQHLEQQQQQQQQQQHLEQQQLERQQQQQQRNGSTAAAPTRRGALLAAAGAAGLALAPLPLAPPPARAVQGLTAGRIPGLSTEPDADGFLTYQRPEGKSGGHGVGALARC